MPGDVFDHDHGIGTRGCGSAGHNLNGLAWLQDCVRKLTGPDFPGDAEAAGDVGGVDRETIAHGTVERRVIAVGKDVGRQHAAGGFNERNVFGLWRLSKLADLTQNGGTGVEKRERRHVV
jgi:hypothetical protein